jgi:hypothetical protein
MNRSTIPAVGPWLLHYPTDGSKIGGSDPAKFGYTVIPGAKPSVVLSQSGNTVPGQYPAVMLYPATPFALPPVQPLMNIEMTFPVWLDVNSLAYANVLETDNLYSITGADGKKFLYQNSVQVILSSGLLEVGSPGAGWQSTLAKLAGQFAANRKHWIRILNQVDTVKHVSSVLSYSVDAVPTAVPEANQNVPAAEEDWTEGGYLQIQQGNNPPGQPIVYRFGGFDFLFW